MIGQLVRREFEAAAAIELKQRDHRRPALAAFAVNVLVKVERQRARAVEQPDVAFLDVENVVRREIGREPRESAPDRGGDQGLGVDRLDRDGRKRLHFGGRIA